MFAGCHSENPELRAAVAHLAVRPEGLGHIPFDERGAFVAGPLVLVQQRQWNTAESKLEAGVITHAASGVRLCAWARIDNRDELLAQLPADLHPLAATDTGLILAAYLKFGPDLCQHLLGDFAFAIHDARDGSFTLGRDHLGVRPLFYFWNGRDFAFATSQAVLDGLPPLGLKLSETWLARFLTGCAPDWSAGAFDHVFKVPPAHTVTFRPGGEPRATRYFQFSPEANLKLGSDAEYVAAYRAVLETVVRFRVRSDYPVAAESSGGLDASAVTALASRAMPNAERDLRAYGFANCVDEPAAIMALSQRFALRSTYLITSTANSWRHHDLHWSTFHRAVGTVPEHWNGFTHWPVYEPARTFGARTLLSGFGGDELVSNPGGVARIEFLTAGNWRALARSMPGNPLFAWLRAFKFAFKHRRSGNTFPLAEALMKQAERRWQARVVADRFATEELHTRAADGSRYDSGCQTVNEFALNNRLSPGLTARLENCTLMAAAFGLEYRWPLLDVRLVQFYLSVPAEQKLGPKGVTRYLHRRAIDDLLPANVVWRDKWMGERIAQSPGLKPPTDLAWSALAPELQAVLAPDRLDRLIQRCQQAGQPDRMDAMPLRNVDLLDKWLRARRSGYVA
ncbi:MAG: hypothetical protein RL514_4456 [Verrucomicrobiota bacterium]|jgi:asparagine synthase (glutamine-hydrolysing)